ncbi:MAG: carboxypeptidase-like regulatory domain-containing protein [Bacteroidetes bacterium]|nr:carboxypeptidase-like regulatory domain-containing protein [Bacteroidota bacterium]
MIKAQPISGTIKGVVFSSGKPLPFANVGISGTTLGAVTNENGQFEITGLRTGNHELRVSFIGYLEFYKSVLLTDKNPVVELSLSIKQLSKALDEIVVTGTRNEKRRIDSAVPVNILDSRIMESTQSLNLAEGLSFQPGIRIEKDCQTCNYTQVRMNGLPGSYTQILINSRALFSSLAGLYGLEQLPASMIERVEIVKGGGSVLYGSSAVAGTINIITKDPTEYGLQMQSTSSLIKSDAFDNQSDLYASAINRKKNAGSSILISHRNRESWDANKDGFSELAAFKNISFGVNTFINPDNDSKIRISMNSINEIRNGRSIES